MAQKLKIIVIDDESAARQNVKQIVSDFCEGFDVVGEADNALNGLKKIKECKPDIILLDIEMPGGSGFDMLDGLNNQNLAVIFITAYNQYAIKAFKYCAIDYLLKPVDIDELNNALKKAKENKSKESQVDYHALFETIENKTTHKLAVNTNQETEYLEIQSILSFEASGSYTIIFLKDGRKILVSKNLKEYEELLGEEGFLRVHNSHLINLNHVKKYIKKDGYTVIMTDSRRIPIAVRRKEIFEELIKKFIK